MTTAMSRALRWVRLTLSRLAASDHMRELDAWERGFRAGFSAAMDQQEQAP